MEKIPNNFLQSELVRGLFFKIKLYKTTVTKL